MKNRDYGNRQKKELISAMKRDYKNEFFYSIFYQRNRIFIRANKLSCILGINFSFIKLSSKKLLSCGIASVLFEKQQRLNCGEFFYPALL